MGRFSSIASLLSFSPPSESSFKPRHAHTHEPLCGSNVLLLHLFMCFSAQITSPPDRKGPNGHTTAVLPKPYVTHSYKLKQLPTQSVLPCVVFLVLSLFDLSGFSDCGCLAVFSSDSIVFACGCCVHIFWAYKFWVCASFCSRISLLSCGFQFIRYQWHLYFHLSGMSPTSKRWESVSQRLGWGLWLVIDGASATHTLSALHLSMHGQTWWLTSSWLFP